MIGIYRHGYRDISINKILSAWDPRYQPCFKFFTSLLKENDTVDGFYWLHLLRHKLVRRKKAGGAGISEKREKTDYSDRRFIHHPAGTFADHKAQLNVKYIMTSYVMALVMISTIVIFALLIGQTGNFGYIYYLLFSGILFPFARIVYDIPLGFRFNYFMEVKKLGNVYLFQWACVMYFVVLNVSIFLAPFGILYLVIKGVRYHGRILEKKEQEHQDNEAFQKEVAALREDIAREDNRDDDKK